jgi:spermidine synthase
MFDEEFRRDLHDMMTNNGVSSARVAQVIDLACHAAEEAAKRLSVICASAPDLGIHAAAMEIGLQLAADHMAHKAKQLHALGRVWGAPQRRSEFEVNS